MSISINNFVNPGSLSPLVSQATRLASSISSGRPISSLGIASTVASAISLAGHPGSTAGDIGSVAVDGAVANPGGNPYITQGQQIDRAVGAAISLARLATSGPNSGKQYRAEITPQGAIDAKTVQDQQNVLDVFPPDIGIYMMRLDFAKYQRPKPFDPPKMEADYSVVFPVPNNLTEFYTESYADHTLGAAGDVINAYDRSKEGSSGTAGNEGTAAATSEILRMGSSAGGTGLVQATADIAQQKAGIAPNPNITVMYLGPIFREFDFTWTFAPKTAEESKTLQRIIKNIKRRVLPIIGENQSTALLGYPSMVQPKLLPDTNVGGKDEALMLFKRSVITNFNVAYSIDGIPSFFKGTKLPTFVQISIHLLEIEYFTNNEDTYNDPIGNTEAGQTVNKVITQNTPAVMNTLKNIGIG